MATWNSSWTDMTAGIKVDFDDQLSILRNNVTSIKDNETWCLTHNSGDDTSYRSGVLTAEEGSEFDYHDVGADGTYMVTRLGAYHPAHYPDDQIPGYGGCSTHKSSADSWIQAAAYIADHYDYQSNLICPTAYGRYCSANYIPN